MHELIGLLEATSAIVATGGSGVALSRLRIRLRGSRTMATAHLLHADTLRAMAEKPWDTLSGLQRSTSLFEAMSGNLVRNAPGMWSVVRPMKVHDEDELAFALEKFGVLEGHDGYVALRYNERRRFIGADWCDGVGKAGSPDSLRRIRAVVADMERRRLDMAECLRLPEMFGANEHAERLRKALDALPADDALESLSERELFQLATELVVAHTDALHHAVAAEKKRGSRNAHLVELARAAADPDADMPERRAARNALHEALEADPDLLARLRLTEDVWDALIKPPVPDAERTGTTVRNLVPGRTYQLTGEEWGRDYHVDRIGTAPASGPVAPTPNVRARAMQRIREVEDDMARRSADICEVIEHNALFQLDDECTRPFEVMRLRVADALADGVGDAELDALAVELVGLHRSAVAHAERRGLRALHEPKLGATAVRLARTAADSSASTTERELAQARLTEALRQLNLNTHALALVQALVPREVTRA